MEANRMLWIAASQPKPGNDAEYNKWYDNHIIDLFKFKDMKKVCRYHSYQDVSSNMTGYAEYLTIYEFDDKESLAAFGQSPEIAAASEDFQANFFSIADIVWCGWYEPIKSLERGEKNDSVIRIVATDCHPDRQTDYNQWYSETHLPMLFEFKDTKRASRYHCYHDMGGAIADSAKYLALYEFCNKEAETAFHQSDTTADAIADWEDKINNSGLGIRLLWSAPYEPLKSLER